MKYLRSFPTTPSVSRNPNRERHSKSRSAVAAHYLHGRTKRILDVGFVVLVIPIVLPVILVLSGLIFATTGDGPIFRQLRYGRDKRPFWMIKLRTMRRTSAPETFLQATRGDLRVTKVGMILRRTSLDELPQIWNVLRGEMSLVGPRPHPVELDEQFLPIIAGYGRRFEVRPGLTGLAQVRGSRGETATVASMVHRIRYDTKYIASASLRVDLILIWNTFAAVLSRKHAY